MLDLCSGWESHLPDPPAPGGGAAAAVAVTVTGHGACAAELGANPRLGGGWFVRDLDLEPRLDDLAAGSFDAALCCCGVYYLRRLEEVVSEVGEDGTRPPKEVTPALPGGGGGLPLGRSAAPPAAPVCQAAPPYPPTPTPPRQPHPLTHPATRPNRTHSNPLTTQPHPPRATAPARAAPPPQRSRASSRQAPAPLS